MKTTLIVLTMLAASIVPLVAPSATALDCATNPYTGNAAPGPIAIVNNAAISCYNNLPYDTRYVNSSGAGLSISYVTFESHSLATQGYGEAILVKDTSLTVTVDHTQTYIVFPDAIPSGCYQGRMTCNTQAVYRPSCYTNDLGYVPPEGFALDYGLHVVNSSVKISTAIFKDARWGGVGVEGAASHVNITGSDLKYNFGAGLLVRQGGYAEAFAVLFRRDGWSAPGSVQGTSSEMLRGTPASAVYAETGGVAYVNSSSFEYDSTGLIVDKISDPTTAVFTSQSQFTFSDQDAAVSLSDPNNQQQEYTICGFDKAIDWYFPPWWDTQYIESSEPYNGTASSTGAWNQPVSMSGPSQPASSHAAVGPRVLVGLYAAPADPLSGTPLDQNQLATHAELNYWMNPLGPNAAVGSSEHILGIVDTLPALPAPPVLPTFIQQGENGGGPVNRWTVEDALATVRNTLP